MASAYGEWATGPHRDALFAMPAGFREAAPHALDAAPAWGLGGSAFDKVRMDCRPAMVAGGRQADLN